MLPLNHIISNGVVNLVNLERILIWNMNFNFFYIFIIIKMPNYKDNVNTSTSQGGRYVVAGFDQLNNKVSLPFGKTNLTGRG